MDCLICQETPLYLIDSEDGDSIMTILSSLEIRCKCRHVFTVPYPQSICTWLSPDLTKDLLDGRFFVTTCGICAQKIYIDGFIMVNTPRGIFYVPSGPPDKIKEFLQKAEVLDENGMMYPPEEIVKRLQENA